MSSSPLPQNLLYHECQDGNLCGVHALNNLLQGPYYSEVDLANIAEELDRRERELLNAQQQQEQTQNQSSNVDETGNFSITVLREAISRSHNIDLDQRNVDTVVADPTQYEGFLLHLQAHWFAIRKIHGYYWNLNSLQPRPSKISEFYLSAFLGQMKEEGYSIFVVQGSLPPPMTTTDFEGSGNWHSLEFLLHNPQPEQPRATHPEDVDDPELRAAIEASLQDTPQERQAMERISGPMASGYGEMNDEDDDLQAALAMSLESNNNNARSEGTAPKETVQEAFIRLQSEIGDTLEQGKESTSLKIDFPQLSSAAKQSVKCKFPVDCQLSKVFSWVALEILKQKYPSAGTDGSTVDDSIFNFTLARRAPSETFTRAQDGDRTIAECDLRNCVLQVNLAT